MVKYEIRWCRIWEFLECVEAETEEEAVKTLHEERATKGSTIEIVDVKSLDVKEEKEAKKEERKKGIARPRKAKK